MENLRAQRSSQEILGQKQGNKEIEDLEAVNAECWYYLLLTLEQYTTLCQIPIVHLDLRLEEEKQLMKNTFASFNESLNVL